MNYIFRLFVLFIVTGFNSYGQQFKLHTIFHDLTVPVSCLTLSSDGRFLIAGDIHGNLVFRNPLTGEIARTEKAFNSPVDNISFNSTGRLMLVSTHEGEIKIYDFLQAKFIQSLYSPEYAGLSFALFSIADGFIYFNGQGRLYKTRSDLTQQVQKIYEFDSVLKSAVITDDRSALIFTCGNAIKVLNTRTDNITQELITSPSKVEKLALLPGDKVVTWSSDGTLAIRRYELNQLAAEPVTWFKAGTCSNMAFSHDGQLMATGNIGNWLRIWKPFDREVLQELFGHSGAVTNFAFSPDDKTLFTSGDDKTIIVWKKEPGDQLPANQPPDAIPVTLEPIISLVLNPATETSLPPIELNSENIPSHVGERKVGKASIIEISDSIIDINVFDNSTLDGDIISLSFQAQWILEHYEVTKEKKTITIHLTPGSNNYLVLFADNMGRTPPNTAAVSFFSKGRERIFRLESDLKNCSSINFVYKGR